VQRQGDCISNTLYTVFGSHASAIKSAHSYHYPKNDLTITRIVCRKLLVGMWNRLLFASAFDCPQLFTNDDSETNTSTILLNILRSRNGFSYSPASPLSRP